MRKEIIKEQLIKELKLFLENHDALSNFENGLAIYSKYTNSYDYIDDFINRNCRMGDAITKAFTWDRTKQSHGYWYNLSIKWRKFIKNGFKEINTNHYKSIW